MSRAEETVIGAAPNVNLRERDPATPFDHDTDERRIIRCECLSCDASETVLAEPGRTREWEHALSNRSHAVHYWREDNSDTDDDHDEA